MISAHAHARSITITDYEFACARLAHRTRLTGAIFAGVIFSIGNGLSKSYLVCVPGEAWRFCLLARRLSSRLTVRNKGGMDELAAAAAAVVLTTDANAADGLAQRGSCGAVSVANAPMEGVEGMTEDKENSGGHAASGEPGAADPKVSVAPTILVCTACTQPLT